MYHKCHLFLNKKLEYQQSETLACISVCSSTDRNSLTKHRLDQLLKRHRWTEIDFSSDVMLLGSFAKPNSPRHKDVHFMNINIL